MSWGGDTHGGCVAGTVLGAGGAGNERGWVKPFCLPFPWAEKPYGMRVGDFFSPLGALKEDGGAGKGGGDEVLGHRGAWGPFCA